MSYERISSTNACELSETHLSNNCAKLAAGGGNTVGSGTVSCGIHLSGDNECSNVGAKVLEKIGKAIKENERLLSGGAAFQSIVSESFDD